MRDPDGDVTVFVEYDRTRRVDKNYDKFLRYEALLTCWWRETDLGCPIVVFVCQDEEHRMRFLEAADYHLTAFVFRWTENAERVDRNVARGRTYFALEADVRRGGGGAIRLPHWPPRHKQRTNPGILRRVPLPGIPSEE